MTAARGTWFARVAAAAPTRLIFLDETWFTTAMGRGYGYAPRGHRLHAAVPLRRWTRLTFVAGLTAGGLIAPRVIDGSMNGDRFEDYVRRALLPVCRPGDVLIQAIHGVRLTDSGRLSPDGSSSPRRATGPWKHVGSCP